MMDSKDTQNNSQDKTIETTVVDSIEPVSDSLDSLPKKRKRGRPKKSEVTTKKAGSRGKVGRPKGDAAIMNEYKARMLASPKSRQVLEAILSAALDDEHKNQAAAWKLVMDRILPSGMFEQEVTKGNQRNAVSITISGVGTDTINIGGSNDSKDDDVIEGDFRDV